MISRAFPAFFLFLQVAVGRSQFTCNNITNHRHYHLLPPTSDCGGILPINRIMGGRDALLGQFPWMAILIQTDWRGVKTAGCGGSVINDKYVLTAAHCIERNVPPSHLAVRLGEHDTSTVRDCQQGTCAPAPLELAVEEKVRHHLYYKTFGREYDIALLRVQGRIRFNDFIQPVCLPVTCDTMGEQFEGVSLTTCGWGNNLDAPQVSHTTVLQYVKVRGVSLARCKEAWPRVTSLRLCAGGPGNRDACQGDSGGPLLHLQDHAPPLRYELVGVVSEGPKCERDVDDQIPAVYTRVGAFLPWILDHIHD